MSALIKALFMTRSEWQEISASFKPILTRHIKTHALTWLLLILLCMAVNANYRLSINMTPSLPQRLFYIRLNTPVKTGDYAEFLWFGGKPYPDGMHFVKKILAGPGDTVIRHGRDYIIGNRTLLGKTVGLVTQMPLFPNRQLPEGVSTLPSGKYFVAGEHEYSLDSRYDKLGLLDEHKIVGRAIPLF